MVFQQSKSLPAIIPLNLRPPPLPVPVVVAVVGSVNPGQVGSDRPEVRQAPTPMGSDGFKGAGQKNVAAVWIVCSA